MTAPRRSTSASGNLLFNRAFVQHPANPEANPTVNRGRWVLAAGRKIFVALVSGPQGTDIHIDGQPVRELPRTCGCSRKTNAGRAQPLFRQLPGPELPLVRHIDAVYPIRPGMDFIRGGRTAGNARRRWRTLPCRRGRVAAVASYRFDRRHRRVDRRSVRLRDNDSVGNWLVWFSINGFSDCRTIQDFFRATDVTLNLLGFVPFGFMVCLRLLMRGKPSPRSCFFLAIAVGFAVSLAIELTQVWLPGRDSSLLDLTTNTMGSAIGGAMAYHLGRAYGTWLKR